MDTSLALKSYKECMEKDEPLLRSWSAEDISTLCEGVLRHSDNFSAISEFLPGRSLTDIANTYHFFCNMLQKSEVLVHLFR
jgi:hypothetical protein